MSASNDSFLKLIGMSDTSMIEEKKRAPVSFAEELAAENTESTETTENTESLAGEHDFEKLVFGDAEGTQTQTEAETEFEDEPTQLNADSLEVMEPAVSDESTETSNPLDVFVEESPEAFAYPADSDFVDEETRSHTELSNQNHISTFDAPEVESLLNELQQDVSKEDHLLAGVEEAEASRATDIYAKSFRADSRKTRAHGKTDESFIDFENQSTAKTKASELEESADISSRTLVLSQELEDGSEPKTKRIEFEDSDPAVEDPEAGLEADDLFDSFQMNKARNSNVSRTTQAFEYQSSASDLAELPRFRLLPLAGHSSSEPISVNDLPYSIGRDPKNNFTIEDNNSSRFHAELRDVQGQVVIVDLNSTNGIQVNGELVPERALQPNDEIQIGNLILRYEADVAPLSQDLNSANPQETMMMPTRKQGVKKSGMKPRTKRLAMVIGFLAVAYIGYQNLGSLSQVFRGSVESYVRSELTALPQEIADSLGKPVSEAEPEDVKTLVLDKMAKFPLPEDYRKYLSQVPAKLYQIILADPKLLQVFIDNNGNVGQVFSELRNRMIEAFKANRNQEALELVELFLQDSPQNEELLKYRKELKDRMAFVKLERGQAVSQEEKSVFVEMMNEHNKTFENFTAVKNFEGAKEFAGTLIERLQQLVKQRPYFSEYTASAVSEWRSKIKQMDKLITERNQRREQIKKVSEKGDLAIEEIKSLFVEKRFFAALLKLNDFIRAYPDHSDIVEMRNLRDYIPVELEKTASGAKDKINEYTQRENFKEAWDLYYTTLDSVGAENISLQAIRVDLDSKTALRGAQYYNQARVFEFEADDIVAAEQYYKKTIDTVDPKSELADKATRRYQAVKRKNLQ